MAPAQDNPNPDFDPNLDLYFERIVEVKPELVWAAWTQPKHILKWFTPAPWKTVECEIDLRPGGRFYTVMRSPEGQEFPNSGCFLEIVENRKLVWTVALLPGYRPAPPRPEGLLFTATIALQPHAKGARYSALVVHGDPEARDRHEKMGFHDGWGKALDQLVAQMKQG